MAVGGMTVIKEFTYRGVPEEWSNTYHLDAHPDLGVDWRPLADALIALEKAVYSPRVTVKQVLCYGDLSMPATYSYILADWAGEVAGTLSATAGTVLPGDCAGWVRWATGDMSSSGKPVYLRKYFHDVMGTTAPDEDLITSVQRTAYQTFGDALLTPLATGYNVSKPDGSLPTGPAKAATYVTTRTLKRRGPRP